MIKTIFQFDRNSCNELASKFFIRDAGLNREGAKFDRMRDDAFRMREVIEDRIFIRAEYAYTENFSIDGRKAEIEGVELKCNAFEQVNSNSIKGVYVYALTVGDFSYPEEPIMDQLYADIWGSAFTDATRILLKQELESKVKLSDSYGPGFYGMDVSQMSNLMSLLNSEELNIEVRNNSVLLPLKSCAGLYFSVNDDYEMLHEECMNCRGSRLNCALCRVREGEI